MALSGKGASKLLTKAVKFIRSSIALIALASAIGMVTLLILFFLSIFTIDQLVAGVAFALLSVLLLLEYGIILALLLLLAMSMLDG